MDDYSQLVRQVVQPEIMETVFTKALDDLKKVAVFDTKRHGGHYIKVPIRTSVSSNAAGYTKADVDPDSGTFVATYGQWTKTYQHTSFEVHGIDEAEAAGGGAEVISGLIRDAWMMEQDQIEQVIFAAILAQWKLDIDETGTYGSYSALSRTTYSTLASYEETTDASITLQYLRTMANTVNLNKKNGGKARYQLLFEPQVYNKFEPVAYGLHGMETQAGQGAQKLGYEGVLTWEQQAVHSITGMTTGDVFYGRKEDFKIHQHRPMSVTQVASGRDSAKFVIRWGITGYVINPGFCGKLLSKD